MILNIRKSITMAGYVFFASIMNVSTAAPVTVKEIKKIEIDKSDQLVILQRDSTRLFIVKRSEEESFFITVLYAKTLELIETIENCSCKKRKNSNRGDNVFFDENENKIFPALDDRDWDSPWSTLWKMTEDKPPFFHVTNKGYAFTKSRTQEDPNIIRIVHTKSTRDILATINHSSPVYYGNILCDTGDTCIFISASTKSGILVHEVTLMSI